MERTIISHNVETATARMRFEHNGVTTEQDFNLWDVVPGTRYVFAQMNLDMDEATQLQAMERVEAMILKGIEDGVIVNAPEPEVHEYVAPTGPEDGV